MSALLPHVQYIEKALKIEPFLSHAEKVFKEPISDTSSENESESDDEGEELHFKEKSKAKNGFLSAKYKDSFSKEEWKTEKSKMYNFGNISDDRGWLKGILLSDNSDDSDDDVVTDEHIKDMLKDHVRRKKLHQKFLRLSEEIQDEYHYYGSSLVMERDRFGEIQRKKRKDIKTTKKKFTSDVSVLKRKRLAEIDERRRRIMEEKIEKKRIQVMKENDNRRRKLWVLIARKEIPKGCKQRNSRLNTQSSFKKLNLHITDTSGTNVIVCCKKVSVVWRCPQMTMWNFGTQISVRCLEVSVDGGSIVNVI